jgi:hypothetical protein
VSLAEAFQKSGFVQPEDQQTNKLGQLLVAAGVVSNQDLEDALQTNIRTGLPLGHIFCFRGFVSQALVYTALLAQQLVRRGMINRDHAIAGLRAAAQRERDLEQEDVNRGFQRLPMKPSIKLGEMFMEARMIGEAQLLDALHRSLLLGRYLGEIFVESNLADAETIDAALDLQEMLDNGTLTQPMAIEALMMVRSNKIPLYQAVAEVGAFKQRRNKAVDLMQILTSSGAVTLTQVPREIQECLGVNYNQAAEVSKLILQHKLLPEKTLYAALRSVYLQEIQKINLQQAIMAFDFAQRANVSLDESIHMLGWTIRTRLRGKR